MQQKRRRDKSEELPILMALYYGRLARRENQYRATGNVPFNPHIWFIHGHFIPGESVIDTLEFPRAN